MTESTVEPTVYVLLPELARQTGLPQTYLKKLTGAGRIPYLDSGRHRHYCLEDVTVALFKLAHASVPQTTESPIDFRDFSTRDAKVLKLLRVTTWEQLAALNVGAHTLKLIEQKLAARQQQGSLWTETATPAVEAIIEPVYDGDSA